eukprot:CAMPEP_0118673040 /NCGR_PEP_ID=MMETSP0800-20121206/98_1 /TAXON_ID=210618 ORGANISM="Striatella unipunctata, Strain CCMP2910" /NCGR_SAMPLE_ID=MMETSP0800 /ASSEMBLY_ACC=CAM_ASM_000638 /LENGTH=251 /DNA_ID=CAMNT_0006568053 /DNA_START=111 /DNA_END=866 /DNA_ORIENTATION=-
MAPPYLDEDQCLVPGEAMVRIEKAPENTRRIFAGIDMSASVDEVWNLLTDYDNLQKVVPNLVVNEVLERYEERSIEEQANKTLIDSSDACAYTQECERQSKSMKGALLKQVGGTRVVGIKFSARTTLEVREWPRGLPQPQVKSPDDLPSSSEKEPCQRYKFPRPFAISRLPTKDITMQSTSDDKGEFRLYQGVWRMQPLPGCAPAGQHAMRLTYAVEVSPRPYLPVRLIEGKIAKDLQNNLQAIRKYLANE